MNHTRNDWLIVARREIMAKLGDKTFLIGTAFSLALILGLVGLQAWLGNRDQTMHVAVTSPAASSFVKELDTAAQQANDNHRVEPHQFGSDDDARAAVLDGDVDVWAQQDATGWLLTFNDGVDSEFVNIASQVALSQSLDTNSAELGIGMDDLTAGSRVQAEQLQGDADLSTMAQIVTIVFALLFFMSAIGFGMQIAQSVVEEKQSRVVEILAAAVPTRRLLAGKVAGNTVMAMAQMVLYAVVGLIGLSVTDFAGMLPGLSGSVVWFLAFFAAGFLALACIWAAAGSLATRQEDLQATTMPLMLVLTVVYMAGFLAEGATRTVLSFVPVVSAILMPSRLVEGTASWWEALLALILNLGFAAITILIGERIYRRALLQTNGRMHLKEALSRPV